MEGGWRKTYLFHVPVVHGVVGHFVRLQLDDLLELVAVALPLADDDHFVKQEDVPCSGERHVDKWAPFVVFCIEFFSCPWIFYSPVLLSPVDDGADLQLSVDLRPAVLLQLDLLLRSQEQHKVLWPLNLMRVLLTSSSSSLCWEIMHGALTP